MRGLDVPSLIVNSSYTVLPDQLLLKFLHSKFETVKISLSPGLGGWEGEVNAEGKKMIDIDLLNIALFLIFSHHDYFFLM